MLIGINLFVYTLPIRVLKMSFIIWNALKDMEIIKVHSFTLKLKMWGQVLSYPEIFKNYTSLEYLLRKVW